MVKTEYFCDICGKPIGSFFKSINQIRVNAFKEDYDSTRICGFQWNSVITAGIRFRLRKGIPLNAYWLTD